MHSAWVGKPLAEVCGATLAYVCPLFAFFCQNNATFSELPLGAMELIDWHEVAAGRHRGGSSAKIND